MGCVRGMCVFRADGAVLDEGDGVGGGGAIGGVMERLIVQAVISGCMGKRAFLNSVQLYLQCF